MNGVLPMAFAGLLVSVVAPVLVLLNPRCAPWWDWERFALPALAAGPLFLVVHDALMILMAEVSLPMSLDLPLHGVLLLGAVVFWLPVLGTRHRLRDAARSAYLFLCAPVLDLAGVWIIAGGDSAGGLAMIVAMLPIGLAAVVLTWRWIVREERLALDADLARERQVRW